MIRFIREALKRYEDWKVWSLYSNYSFFAKLGALFNVRSFAAIHFAVFRKTLED